MRHANLMLHCGSELVTADQIRNVDTPEPDGRWYPVAHQLLIDKVTDSITHGGFDVVQTQHGLSEDGARYFGLMQIQNGTNADDHGLIIGIRNSHDKRFAAALALGSCVFVCDNLSFSGEYTLARRHTKNIERDLSELVLRAIEGINTMKIQQEERIAWYKQHEFGDSEVHDLLIRSMDSRCIPNAMIPKILKEWREPTYEDFQEGGCTAWRLFNAYTEAMKPKVGRGSVRRLDQLSRRTRAIHGMLDIATGLIPASMAAAHDDVHALDNVLIAE